MKLSLQLFQAIGKPEDPITGFLRDLVLKLRRAVDSAGLGYGDGTTNDNMMGVWANYTTNAVANTEDAITHNLGGVPIGYVVFSQDKAASLYKGATAWSSTQIFLKCSVATVAVRIFIFPASNLKP